jgi:hypothetical protein
LKKVHDGAKVTQKKRPETSDLENEKVVERRSMVLRNTISLSRKDYAVFDREPHSLHSPKGRGSAFLFPTFPQVDTSPSVEVRLNLLA